MRSVFCCARNDPESVVGRVRHEGQQIIALLIHVLAPGTAVEKRVRSVRMLELFLAAAHGVIVDGMVAQKELDFFIPCAGQGVQIDLPGSVFRVPDLNQVILLKRMPSIAHTFI